MKNQLTEGQKTRAILTIRALIGYALNPREYFFEPDEITRARQLCDELEFEEVDPVVAEAVRIHRGKCG